MAGGNQTWIRGKPANGLRQINIRYDVGDEKFQVIEDMLERVPYKRVNEIMREALKLGCTMMLQQANAVNEVSQAISKPEQQRKPQGFGKAASGMFELYGEDKK